jgi:hypothetical protein
MCDTHISEYYEIISHIYRSEYLFRYVVRYTTTKMRPIQKIAIEQFCSAPGWQATLQIFGLCTYVGRLLMMQVFEDPKKEER